MINYEIKNIIQKNKLDILFKNNKKISADIVVDVTSPMKFIDFLKKDILLKDL